MSADERATALLFGVFDAGSCWLFHDVFALALPEHMLESSFSLGDAWIQPPQEVGLRGHRVKFDDDDLCCGSEMSNCSREKAMCRL